MLRSFIKFLLKLFFRVQVQGFENYTAAGNRVLLVINVGSLLDMLLLSTFLPHRISVVVDTRIAKKWWLCPILSCAHVIEIDFNSKTATLNVVRAIERHERCVVFQSSRHHYDDVFMKLLESTALTVHKAKACLLPIRIEGAAYSYFSYYRHKQRLQYFPKISLAILPPQYINFTEDVSPRLRRKHTATKLYKIITTLMLESTNLNKNVMQAFVEAVSIHGRKYIIAEDHERKTITYGTMLLKTHVLARALSKHLKKDEHVGFLLPSSLVGIVCFLALQTIYKVPAFLNFTAGIASILSACKTVQIKSIVSSKKFIKLADLEHLRDALINDGIHIIYLEDIAKQISLADKIKGALAAKFLCAPNTKANSPLAILFTSGTEGHPKAVFMSHKNALTNREQILSSVYLHSGDRLFNSLPMFHTFGLGVGTILPITTGMKVFMYPSPLHYRIVPKLFYESMSTVICGTDTFFAGYARYGQPYDFCNARLVISGAEKLRDATARTWKEKYNVHILEGYGTTETSPVISVNTPAHKRHGSVGRIFPGMEYRIKPVENIKEGGTLCVKAGNVMLGYMRASNPGVLEPPREFFEPSSSKETIVKDSSIQEKMTQEAVSVKMKHATKIDNSNIEHDAMADGWLDGWYDTGDIVTVDNEDFIYIKGRAKRFAKLGGEMVSLVAVEMAISVLFEDTILGIVAIPDEKKGEQLILIIEKENISPSQIATYFASKGISALWVPKRILSVKQAPILGSGKFDYVSAKNLALQSTTKSL